MTMKYEGKGWRNNPLKEQPLMLEVTMEAYKEETICTFEIYNTSNEYVSEEHIVPEISMSLEEVTRLRDELNFLIEHERKHREAKYGNECGDYVVNEVMENMFTISLEEEVEFAGRRQVTDNVKKLIKERETK